MVSVRKRQWAREGKCRESWEVYWIENGRRFKKAGFETKEVAEAWALERQKAALPTPCDERGVGNG